jgi:nucleoside-diphosphate-sugar epimerase
MGDGTQTRDWTYVGDIVDGLLQAALREEAVGEAINLASGRETRVIDMALMVNELVGNRAGVQFIPMRKWDTKRRLLACVNKARALLEYEPKTEFRRGLEATVQWFQQNWENIKAATGYAQMPGHASRIEQHREENSAVLSRARG